MRVRRLTLKIVVGFLLIGAIASVGVVTPRTIHVVGPRGAPVQAWAAYHYEGTRFNLTDSISYRRTGAVSNADADGVLRLPGMIYLRFPLDGWLQPRIDLLYVPALHSAITYPLAAQPVPRIFERSADGRNLKLADQTGDPELWARSLEQLYSLVRFDLLDAALRKFPTNQQDLYALAQEMIADYRTFIARHAATPRTVPTIGMEHLQYAPEAEREATLARIRDDLAREPTWGPHMERIWVPRISELQQTIRKSGAGYVHAP